MKIAFANAAYDPKSTSGGNTHVYQFITNSIKLGHDIWLWPEDKHPDSNKLPSTKINRWIKLLKMDCIYVRLDWFPPPIIEKVSHMKKLIGKKKPVIVWEFNTVPEFGALVGANQAEIQNSRNIFQKFSPSCNLAICVSDKLTTYSKKTIGLSNAITVPNSSDPNLFRPRINRNQSLVSNSEFLDVVWIGSAHLGWHDTDLLFSTAKLLHYERKARFCKFHIIGRGLRFPKELPPNCKYHGPISYLDLPSLLSTMDIGLVLYHQGVSDFSSPLKFFDYLSCGLIVISTPQPQVTDILTELNQPDVLLSNNDPEELADILFNLSINGEKRKSYSQTNRKIIEDKYNWYSSINKTYNEIGKILN